MKMARKKHPHLTEKSQGKFPQPLTILSSLLQLPPLSAQEPQFSVFLVNTGQIFITWYCVQTSWLFLHLCFSLICTGVWFDGFCTVKGSNIKLTSLLSIAPEKWILNNRNIISTGVLWSLLEWGKSSWMKKPSPTFQIRLKAKRDGKTSFKQLPKGPAEAIWIVDRGRFFN